MPAPKQDKVLVTCPHCGHQQREPREVISTVCKKCRQHLRVEEILKLAVKALPAKVQTKAAERARQDEVLLTCPHCGNQQREPREVISTVCKKCSQHLRVEELLKPAIKKAPAPLPQRAEDKRRVTCFDCGTELEVAPTAESTMCKRCSRHIDLRDYKITSAVSKNFKTKGAFVIEQKGYVFNTEAIVGDAVIRGRFLGKLFAERLTIYSSAEFKGTFKAGRLIIPEENHFRWAEPLKLASAEIGGELVANVQAEGTVVLKSTARMFGDVEAGGLVVEAGAVVVGNLRIGAKVSG